MGSVGRKRLSMSEGAPEERRYHVVGVRPDGSIAVMGDGLSAQEARRVRDALAQAEVFSAVQIKAGDPKKTRD